MILQGNGRRDRCGRCGRAAPTATVVRTARGKALGRGAGVPAAVVVLAAVVASGGAVVGEVTFAMVVAAPGGTGVHAIVAPFASVQPCFRCHGRRYRGARLSYALQPGARLWL